MILLFRVRKYPNPATLCKRHRTHAGVFRYRGCRGPYTRLWWDRTTSSCRNRVWVIPGLLRASCIPPIYHYHTWERGAVFRIAEFQPPLHKAYLSFVVNVIVESAGICTGGDQHYRSPPPVSRGRSISQSITAFSCHTAGCTTRLPLSSPV